MHDADEQAAQAAKDTTIPPAVRGGEPRRYDWSAVVGFIVDEYTDAALEAGHQHAARHDPQSVLARVEAERALAALHGGMHACCLGGMTARAFGESDPCPTLRALAWGYRGHEGFDPAWAPEGADT